jgi:hypothetical protein
MVADLVDGIVLRSVSYRHWKDLSRNSAEDGECGVRALPCSHDAWAPAARHFRWISIPIVFTSMAYQNASTLLDRPDQISRFMA